MMGDYYNSMHAPPPRAWKKPCRPHGMCDSMAQWTVVCSRPYAVSTRQNGAWPVGISRASYIRYESSQPTHSLLFCQCIAYV